MPAAGTPVTRPGDPMSAQVAGADADPHTITVPGHAAQVRRARAFTASTLADYGLCAETACLLVGELVANSVRHSDSRYPDGTVTISVAVRPGTVLAEVTDDGGPAEPVLREWPGTFAENGRGLWLVDTMANDWGYRRAGDRRVTWFTLTAEK